MPTTDYTEFLHNVKQEYITNSYELDGIFIFDIELPVTPHICPHCKHSFAESNPFVRKHMQLSVTNIRMLFDKLTESVTYNAIAKECDTSITTVLRYYSMITIPKPRTLPTVIGIDEFKGNAEGYRYHVCRLVDWAVERVRKREQHKLAAYSRMLKQNRRVLMKHPDHLTEDEYIKLCEILRISDNLRKAYALKLSFRKIFSTYGKQGIAAHLTHWLELVKASGMDEFNNFFTSFPAWMTQLTNAFLLPYSNGYTEETNNKIKVLKRISYGLRHFGRFRVRILLLSKKEMANLH